MGFIRGYKDGANITLLNVIYHKPVKIAEDHYKSTYTKDSIDIVFKDMDTGEKKVQHIEEPEYTYYILNENIPANYHRMYVDVNMCHPVTCKYTDLKKSIAQQTDNLEFFYDNIRSGNYRENDRLFHIPTVFGADMNIEDYYRWLFARSYKNEYVQEKVSKLYFDIEADTKTMRGDFPEPGECPINAVTLVDVYNKHIYTLLLEDYSNPLIEEFKKEKDILAQLKAFVRERVGGWKEEVRYGLDKFDYKIMFYDEEINLIVDMFSVINTVKPDFALAWNIAFDLPYIIARIQVLGYNPADIICHPDFKVKECYYYIDKRADKFEERGDFAQISCYTAYVDQLITFASRRKGQRAVESYKLDYIGDKFAHVRKLDYSAITTNLTELPRINYKVFVFYNVMDTIVQHCVEVKVGDVDFIYSKSLLTNTRYSKVHRQTVYLINIITSNFWKEGFVMGCNVNKSNQKEGFAGAYVADPRLVSEKPKLRINDIASMLCMNCVDFDYTALYPSIIDENNMAPYTQLGKIIFPQAILERENKFDNAYFDRSVWFIEDLVSKNRLLFCHRYFRLADYKEMYHDIIEYFTTVKAPWRGLRKFDTLTGKRIMCEVVPNKDYRTMCVIVDNSKPKEMCISRGKMPKWEGKNKDANNNDFRSLIPQ